MSLEMELMAMILNKHEDEYFEVPTIDEIYALPDPIMTYPIIIDDTPVKVCGYAPMQIWWQGKQWAVTHTELNVETELTPFLQTSLPMTSIAALTTAGSNRCPAKAGQIWITSEQP